MARQPSQLTVEIRDGIKAGLSNENIATICGCTTDKVSTVRSRDKHRVKERNRKKQREYNARHRAKKRREQEEAKAREEAKRKQQQLPLFSEEELVELQNIRPVQEPKVHETSMKITMEEPIKRGLWARIKAVFVGD